MKFSNVIPSRSFMRIAVTFLFCLGVFTVAVSAQRAKPEAQPPNLDQCANGPNGDLACTGSQWQNGNLNQNQAKWIEGNSVPYRATVPNMSIGETFSLSIEWDTTEGTDHALDYITSFDRSVPVGTADPCSGVTGCTLASLQTFPIPDDPRVTAAGVNPVDGSVFSIYGGTIDSVSAYFYSGPADYTGTSKAGITINFTSNVDGSVVLAWGGHIGTRIDWGTFNTAVNLSGSPYHMRILGTGNQDRSLSVEAVIFPAAVTIIKIANPYDLTGSSAQLFGFSASANFGTTSFFLQDNNNNGDGFSDTIVNSSVTLFGAANSINVTELIGSVGNGWSISDISCVDTDGGFGTTADSTPQTGDWTNETAATIIVQEGEFVTCTFTNDQQQPTAAPANLYGRVITANGRGISGARMELVDHSTGEVRSTVTNTFGYYSFTDLTVGDFYSLTVSAKRYRFADLTRSFTLNEDMFDMDFAANP